MRIAHIVNHIRECGNGVTNVVVDLACLQAKEGHQVLVIAANGEYQKLLESYDVRYFKLEHNGLKKNPIKLIKTAHRYRKILRQFQPDIVHAHQTPGMILAKLFQVGLGYSLVSTVHCEFEKGTGVMGWADRVIAISHAVARSMLQRGVPSQNIKIVFNGTLGSPRHRPLEQYSHVPLQHPAITTVAGMFERKGIAELIQAFIQIAENFPEVHLYIVGEGPDRTKFEMQAQRTLVTDRIHFEGFQSEPQRYLLASDIFVLASHREPFGLVISEAREAGCAIIASNVDGIPEALDGGQAGLLVPPADSSALAAVLETLLREPDLLNLWKKRAQHNLQWLTTARVHRETLAVYSELISPKP
jgi:glycosyltransferase involved in cell wall biosynthesis